jgi:multicomponent Na+:H+ antiporter subunit D
MIDVQILPILQILVPLIAAPLAVLFRERLTAWLITVAAGWFCLYSSVMMLFHVRESGTMVYKLGNWPKHVGIHYNVDIANVFILVIVSAVAAVVFPYAKFSIDKEIPHEKHHYFYAMLLLCMTGLMGMAITGDAFNVFVFLEISSLSTYALIAMGKDPRCLTAAYRYLVLGTIGGTFILLGIGFLYMMTGTLNVEELSEYVHHHSNTSTIRTAFAFITVGASIKLALWPLHTWLPNAYTYAPSVVSAFLSATATKVSFYVLIRAMFTIFGAALAAQATRLEFVMTPLALMAIFSGSWVAIGQIDVKRLLAYSSIAQIGYMILGLSLHNVNALTGAIIHLFNHALMKGGLFLALGCVFYRIGSTKLTDMKGIGKDMPYTMFAFAIGGLSLIGVPLTAGFISKWYLVLGTFDANEYWLAALVLIASLLAVCYVFKVIETAYFQEPDEPRNISDAPLTLLIPTYILLGASVYFGIFTEPMLDSAKEAAIYLLSSGGE